MTTITQLDIWKDVGFTEGCIEVPSASNTLPYPDHTVTESLNPPTTELFSSIRVRLPYDELLECSYLRITMEMNNGSNGTYYGWIDNITVVSDTDGSPVTRIDWHVDLWRTYLPNADIGSGVVMRRKPTSDIPPQNYPYRYRLRAGQMTPIVPDSGIWWIIFKFVQKVSVINWTLSCIGAFPVNVTRPDSTMTMTGPTTIDGTGSTSTVQSLPLDYVGMGLMEEAFKMDPNSIVSIWLSPIPPQDFGDTSPYQADGWSVWDFGQDSTSGKWGFLFNTGYRAGYSRTLVLPEEIKTDDVNSYTITGFNGEPVGTLPWGVPVRYLQSRLIIDSSSAVMEIRATDTNQISTEPAVEGTQFDIPLIPVEMTQNTYSSYVYSGARNADLSQMRTNALNSFTGGLMGSVSGASTGYMVGAMNESLSANERSLPTQQSIMNRGTLGALGGIGGIATATLGLAVSPLMDSMNIKAMEHKAAAQSNGILLAGTGFDVFAFGSVPNLVWTTIDTYSKDQRQNDMDLYGAHVSEARTSCQSLVNAGGPLQIENAVVTGSIPVQAKNYIRKRLSQGVRII